METNTLNPKPEMYRASFGIRYFGFRLDACQPGLESRAQLTFRGFRCWDRLRGSGFRLLGSGIWFQGLGFRSQGFVLAT